MSHNYRKKYNMIEKKIKQVKNKYRKKTKIQCPAFNNETVMLGTHFWTHIQLSRNERIRPNKEILLRLNAVETMIDIVENITHFQDFYIGKDKNTIMYFWTIIAIVNDIRYGVIIRRKGKQGNKHFYSIIPNYEGCIPRDKKLKIHFE